MLQTITKQICNFKSTLKALPSKNIYTKNRKIKFAIYYKTICNLKSKYSQIQLVKFIIAAVNLTLLNKFTFTVVSLAIFFKRNGVLSYAMVNRVCAYLEIKSNCVDFRSDDSVVLRLLSFCIFERNLNIVTPYRDR